MKTIIIDGKKYKLVSDENERAISIEGRLEYVIVRTYSAGVFAGYLKERNGKEVIIHNARRLWKWAGAATLSQLAEEGVSKPEECKFPQEVYSITVTEAIEILSCTEKARQNIAKVPVWKE